MYLFLFDTVNLGQSCRLRGSRLAAGALPVFPPALCGSADALGLGSGQVSCPVAAPVPKCPVLGDAGASLPGEGVVEDRQPPSCFPVHVIETSLSRFNIWIFYLREKAKAVVVWVCFLSPGLQSGNPSQRVAPTLPGRQGLCLQLTPRPSPPATQQFHFNIYFCAAFTLI